MTYEEWLESRSARVCPSFVGKNVLVTGGFGFIGSHLSSRLEALGARVTVLDLHADPSRGSLLNLQSNLRKKLTVVACSINDFEQISSLIEHARYDVIFHCASFASTIERAQNSPRETVQANTIGLVNLLESLRLAKHQPQAIVHTSTDKVYGDSAGAPYDEDSTPLRASGVYDVSKLAADVFARMYNQAYALPTVVARLCNIFGPFDFNTNYRIVPRAMRALFAEARPSPPELYEESVGHGRDYLYIDDCVDALLLLASSPNCVGKVFNLPGCCHLKTPEMLKTLVKIAASVEAEENPERSTLIENNGIRMVRARNMSGPTALTTQTCDGQRLRETTGFSPRISLDNGLFATCLAYRQMFQSHRQESSATARRVHIVHAAHAPRRMGKSRTPTVRTEQSPCS